MISKALVTVTLNPPSPKQMFSNQQAELKCEVTAEDSSILSETEITWNIDGQEVTDSIAAGKSSDKTKTSILTRNLTDWKTVKKVSCSAVRNDVTPIMQVLTIHTGNAEPKVTVHMVPEEDVGQRDSDEVSLVCLVSSSEMQDYYITWSEDSGHNNGPFTDGITFPRQKTSNGYSVANVYTTTKKEWNKNKIFNCNVWVAGSENALQPKGVSKNMGSNVTFAIFCIDGVIDEDDFSSLWSTAASFIFLFIFSLLYSMIFSLVQCSKFLGVHVAVTLTWSLHTSSITKKAHQRLIFLRRVKTAHLSTSVLTSFYRGTLERVLTSSSSLWHESSSASDWKALKRVVRAAERIPGVSLPPVKDLAEQRCLSRELRSSGDPTHPGCGLFSLLPSCRRYRSLK
ncbi:immunoglobulin heavy constant mu [Xenentodon cancila]